MPDYVRQALTMAEAHPMGAVVAAVVVVLYLNLMMSDPRSY
ncbi:MAG TPA: hypothetical protein VFH92_09345 [Phenylobacterium sp.]|nr:hypothetical protein [Phenylobacterium sp.]